jgi:hypothetical protein
MPDTFGVNVIPKTTGKSPDSPKSSSRASNSSELLKDVVMV